MLAYSKPLIYIYIYYLRYIYIYTTEPVWWSSSHGNDEPLLEIALEKERNILNSLVSLLLAMSPLAKANEKPDHKPVWELQPGRLGYRMLFYI